MNRDFELIEHTADVQLRVYGITIEVLFIHALQGMFQIVEPQSVGKNCEKRGDRLACKELPIKRDIQIRSYDQSSLLIDFLSHVLYLSDIHNEAYLDCVIHELEKTHMKATIHGIKVERFAIEIKAVTYHDFELKKVNGHWQADIVFDI